MMCSLTGDCVLESLGGSGFRASAASFKNLESRAGECLMNLNSTWTTGPVEVNGVAGVCKFTPSSLPCGRINRKGCGGAFVRNDGQASTWTCLARDALKSTDQAAGKVDVIVKTCTTPPNRFTSCESRRTVSVTDPVINVDNRCNDRFVATSTDTTLTVRYKNEGYKSANAYPQAPAATSAPTSAPTAAPASGATAAPAAAPTSGATTAPTTAPAAAPTSAPTAAAGAGSV